MGKLKTETNEIEVNDGDPIINAAESLGTPFSCKHGNFGTCRIEVLEGMENLEPLTDAETKMGLENSPFRLACQCKLKQGEVKIQI